MNFILFVFFFQPRGTVCRCFFLRTIVIYRPQYSSNFPVIPHEFASCLESIVISSEPLLKAGDYFNILVDVPENRDKVSLLSLREHPVFSAQVSSFIRREKGLFLYTKNLTILHDVWLTNP